MNYYSDPTASAALGNINREFSAQTKKAKALYKLYTKGHLTEKDLEVARQQFTGIYRHVLDNVIKQAREEK